MALVTTNIFILSGNFWLCLACDLAVEMAVAIWFPLPKQIGPIPSAGKTGPATTQGIGRD